MSQTQDATSPVQKSIFTDDGRKSIIQFFLEEDGFRATATRGTIAHEEIVDCIADRHVLQLMRKLDEEESKATLNA